MSSGSIDLLLPCFLLGWAIVVHRREVGLGPAVVSFGVTVGVLGLLGATALRPLATTALRIQIRLRTRLGREAPPEPPPLPLSRGLRHRVVWLSVGRYLLLCVQYFGMGAGVGVTLPVVVVLSAAPVAQLAALVAITPGGLGFQEGGWAGALAWLGQGSTAISIFVIAVRLGMVVNFGILSLASVRWRRAPADQSGPVSPSR